MNDPHTPTDSDRLDVAGDHPAALVKDPVCGMTVTRRLWVAGALAIPLRAVSMVAEMLGLH